MMSKKRWVLGAALVGATAVAAYLARRSDKGVLGAEEALRIEVKRKDLVIEVVDTGKVKPKEKVEIKSKVAGQVVEVHAHEGDVVKKGDLLLRLDPVDFHRDVARAEAEVAQAENSLEFARLNVMRRKQARKDRGVAQVEVELAESEVRSRVISLRIARIALARARDRLRSTRVTSPISGTVLELNVQKGEVVTPGVQQTFEGRSLLTVGDLSTLIVETDVNQIDIAKIRVGQQVTLTFDAYPGRTFEATVTKASPAAVKSAGEEEVERFPVEATLAAQDSAIKPGMTADVRFRVEVKEGVFTVPIEAVIRENGKTYVTKMVEAEGRVTTERVEVALGARNDLEIELVTGISERDRLVIDPAALGHNEVEL